jgi:hypothetical protein
VCRCIFVSWSFVCLHRRCWRSILPGLINVTDGGVLFALSYYNLVGVPFFFTSPCNVTVGVSGFEGREVFSRWLGFVISKYSMSERPLLRGPHSGASPIIVFAVRCQVSSLGRYTLKRCTYIL